MDRKRDSAQADAACPFFRRSDAMTRKIYCEGLIPRTGAQHTFDRKRGFDYQLKAFCGQDYQYCEHYRAIMREKYGEEDDQ